MKIGYLVTIIPLTIMFNHCSPSKINIVEADIVVVNKLRKILEEYPQYFDSILKRKDELNVQVIYTEINRDKNGHPGFTDFYFNVNDNNYFYPASTVKLPVAVLALQKLNELKITSLDKNTIMLTGTDSDSQTPVVYDSSAAGLRPTIAHYIKKILLVSDNDAFNRLYEFLGQEYINYNLHKMGYTSAQIIHRLSIALSEEENRHTNPVSFYSRKVEDDTSMQVIYKKPAQKSNLVYAHRDTKLGNSYFSGDSLINKPFDFSKKNRLSASDLHNIIRSVIFPKSVPQSRRFGLTPDDYKFLYKYMSMFPRESKYPVYDSSKFSDAYVKHFMCGDSRDKASLVSKADLVTTPCVVPEGIRIFNKTGTAYGFLIDASYIVDFNNNIEFLLTAVISCNSDGIYNDDQYEYDSIGYPFFRNLGKVIYDHELKRKRKYKPDLSEFKIQYK